MSPDIEWRIGETADDETIVPANPPAARWRTAGVIIVVSLGIGLGVLYSSTPEPPPRPIVLPPTPISSPPDRVEARDTPRAGVPIADEYTRFNLLRKIIDQEVSALADGDEAAFIALQDQTDKDWLETQRQDFQAWGRPPAQEARPGALYFYSERPSNLSVNQETWIDISQYRQGRTFRETRFYRWQIDHWVRVRPSLTFWDVASIEILTPRFRVNLPYADSNLASAVVQRLEYAYQQICFDLACPDDVLTPTRPLPVQVSPDLARGQSRIALDDPPTLYIPSPRVSGLLEAADSLNRDDPLVQLLYARLSEILARAISGGSARWSANSNGMLYLIAVAQWELLHTRRGIDQDAYIGVDLLRGRKITSPQYLWDWPVRDGRRLASPQAQTNSVIAFIDRSFGAERVVNFLRTLHTAQSLPQAIEAALPISYASFEQQWQVWLETRLNE